MGRLEIVKKRVANLGNRRKANAIVADLSWALDEVERLRAVNRRLHDATIAKQQSKANSRPLIRHVAGQTFIDITKKVDE